MGAEYLYVESRVSGLVSWGGGVGLKTRSSAWPGLDGSYHSIEDVFTSDPSLQDK